MRTLSCFVMVTKEITPVPILPQRGYPSPQTDSLLVHLHEISMIHSEQASDRV